MYTYSFEATFETDLKVGDKVYWIKRLCPACPKDDDCGCYDGVKHEVVKDTIKELCALPFQSRFQVYYEMGRSNGHAFLRLEFFTDKREAEKARNTLDKHPNMQDLRKGRACELRNFKLLGYNFKALSVPALQEER